MIERAELDAMILEDVRAFPPGEWVTADLMQRMVRSTLGYAPHDPDAPSLAWVARRMSALAKAGELEREVRDGAWAYRAR